MAFQLIVNNGDRDSRPAYTHIKIRPITIQIDANPTELSALKDYTTNPHDSTIKLTVTAEGTPVSDAKLRIKTCTCIGRALLT